MADTQEVNSLLEKFSLNRKIEKDSHIEFLN